VYCKPWHALKKLQLRLVGTGLGGVGPSFGKSGASAMPSAATQMGPWYADTYAATPKPNIPRAGSVVAISQNILNAPRRLFNTAAFFSSNLSTITDPAEGAADEASSVVGAAGDWYINTTITALPAGTWTYSVDVELVSGAADVRIGNNSAMAAKTISGTRSTISTTFVTAGAALSLIILRNGSGSATTFKIINARLHSGSSDLGVDVLDGHMYFGPNMYDNQPTYAAGELTLNASGKFGVVQFPASTTLTAYTALALGKKKAVPGGQIQAFLSKITAYTDFAACYTDANATPGGQFNAITVTAGSNAAGLWQQTLNQWDTITTRYDAANFHVFMEDTKAHTQASASKTASIRDLFVHIAVSSGIYAKYTFSTIALWTSALTDAGVYQAVAATKARAALSGITSIGTSKWATAEGDSLTSNTGAAAGSYEFIGGPSLSPAGNGIAKSLPSATLQGAAGSNSLQGRLATDLAVIPTNKQGRTYIYSMLIGRNDGSGWGTAANYAAAVAAHIATVRVAGGYDKVVLCTILPSTLAGFNTWRNAVNTIFTGVGWAAANGVDAIADFAADATMGPDAAASDATYYPDGTHPSNAGQAILGPIWAAAVNTV
jgi:lysophospholipase L1-like esterase